MVDISFDDLIPKSDSKSDEVSFDDLTPEKKEKGSYLSGDQGLVPDVAEDIGKGIYSGVISVPQGILELGAIFVDGALNTNTASAVTDAFEYIKPEMGTAGDVTEDLVAFGVGFVPVVGWLGRAGQAAKAVQAGKKLSKAGRTKFGRSAIDFGSSKVGQTLVGSRPGMIGSTAVGALGYSTAVASDGRTTLSDNFEILPDALETEEDAGLTGRQEAARRFRNKLRSGVEDMFLSGAVDTALTVGGAGIRAVGRTDRGAKAAQAVIKAPSKVAEGMAKGFDAIGMGAVNDKAKGARDLFREYFTASGGADVKLYETVQDARAVADMSERMGVKAAEDFDKATKKFLKASKLKDETPVDAQRVEAALNKFLLGDRKQLEAIGSEQMIKAADAMIDVRANLEDDLIRQLQTEVGVDADGKLLTPDTPAKQKAAKALEEMLQNQKNQVGYLRRQFNQYINPINFYKGLDLSSKEFDEAVDEVANIIVPSGQGVDDNIRALAKERVLDTLGLYTTTGVSPEVVLKDKIKQVTREAKGGKTGLVARDRPVLTAMDDLFIAREPLVDKSPKLQRLKGLMTDPKEVYKKTISDMAQANAAADMYRGMIDQGLAVDAVEGMKLLNQGGRPAIIDIPDKLRMTDEQYQNAMEPFREIVRQRGIKRGEVVDDAGNVTVSPKEPAEELLEQYRADLINLKGYKALGDNRDIQHVFGGAYGDLTGRLVSPETYGAITAPLKFGSNTVLGEAAGVLSQLRSLSQKMTIVPNPGAQVRNIAGNFLMLGANANLGRQTDFSDMFKVLTASVADLDEAGLTRLAKKISLSGVEDTSLVVRALRDFGKAGEDLTSNTAKVAKTIDMWTDKIPFMQTFEKVYGESDTFFKGLALLGEEKKILNAFKAAGLEPDDERIYQALMDAGLAKRYKSAVTEFGDASSDLLPYEVMAADAVKDTMPIYPRIGKAVRALDVFPLIGNFTSFASENIRNSANILGRGLKEMSFTIPPELRQQIGEEAASAFERQIRGEGAQRLMSYTAVATIGPSQAVKATMYATGTTQEQYDALKSQLPRYMDGHQLLILSNDQKGKVDYIDLSYVSPYAFVLDPARAALEIYKREGKLDKSQVERIGSGALRGLTMFAEPFGEESLIYERLRDVLPSKDAPLLSIVGRGGKTENGVPVYNSTDSIGDKIDKATGHLLNGVIPAYSQLIGEVDRPFSALDVPKTGNLRKAVRETFNQGRVLRSITGAPGGRGEEYKPFKEGARLVTGFTPMTLDIRNDFAFAGKAYTPRRTEAKSAAQRDMKKGNLTMEDMLTSWDTYLDNLYREQSNLYQDIEAARKLMPGLSKSRQDTIIRQNLTKGAKLGKAEANAIMNGEFWPTDASKELWKDLIAARKAEGRTFITDMSDFSPFNQRSRDRKRQPLSLDSPGDAPRATVPSKIPSFDDLIPSNIPSFDDLIPTLDESSLSVPIAPPTVPTAPTITASNTQVDPTLLGGDPATQALAKSLGRV
tara:strand:- start:14058 stop:18530 length:4473 start_codon:yes stop_codon:yes gene_type:complete